jgi:AraC-like DNA-binding protein
MIDNQLQVTLPPEGQILSAFLSLQVCASGALPGEAPDEAPLGERAPKPARASGLAPWQLRRVKSLIDSNLQNGISVQELADACRLSRSHFAHAFKTSTGFAPHCWFVLQRVAMAKRFLRESALSLCEIALECGFADQSHFTRQFRRETGTTPNAWRRIHMTDGESSGGDRTVAAQELFVRFAA